MSLLTFVTQQHLTNEIRTSKNFEISTFRASIKTAAEKYLYPALSEAFCLEIFDGTVTDSVAIPLVREALICFGAEIYFDIGMINIGAEGISESTLADQKPARLEIISIAQTTRAEIGHMKIDLVLNYLESNSETQAYATWKASEAYTILHEFPISTTKEFDKYCRIRESRSIFLALRPAMQQAMMINLQEVLDAKELAVLTEIQTKNFNTLIKNALANFAYGYGIFDLATTFGFDTILSFSNLNASRQKGYEKIARDMLEAIEQRKFALANAALDKAIKLVADNTPSSIPDDETAYQNDPDSRLFWF